MAVMVKALHTYTTLDTGVVSYGRGPKTAATTGFSLDKKPTTLLQARPSQTLLLHQGIDLETSLVVLALDQGQDC